MKIYLGILSVVLIYFLNPYISVSNSYDSTLALKYGADEYGMKSYFLIILKTGTNEIKDKSVRDSIFKGHFTNMEKLANDGILVVAGPIQNNEKLYRGIFVFNLVDEDEAKKYLNTDPAIKSKVLDYEIYKWYGSAALMQVNEIHEKLQKKKIE
jgi:uncharacterized protein YciI